MQLVPVIPQPKIGIEESLEVKGVAAVKPAKPVAVRTLPPLVRSHALPAKMQYETVRPEKRQITPQEDRRIICRRLHHMNMLEELRSARDRRRRQLRGSDLQLHMDEEV